MFDRKFKSEYKSKNFNGCEEGTNFAVSIKLSPEKDINIEMLGTWCVVFILSSFALGFLGSFILGIICALIVLYNATEKIE